VWVYVFIFVTPFVHLSREPPPLQRAEPQPLQRAEVDRT